MNRSIDNPQPAFPRRIDHGIALLRISFGLMLFAHGLVLKFMTFGLAGTAGFFESIGFPGWTAYAVFAAETVGGLALIAGIGTRWVSVAILPVLLGALYVHLGNGWVFPAAAGVAEDPAVSEMHVRRAEQYRQDGSSATPAAAGNTRCTWSCWLSRSSCSVPAHGRWTASLAWSRPRPDSRRGNQPLRPRPARPERIPPSSSRPERSVEPAYRDPPPSPTNSRDPGYRSRDSGMTASGSESRPGRVPSSSSGLGVGKNCETAHNAIYSGRPGLNFEFMRREAMIE